jgi:hypothetical protein
LNINAEIARDLARGRSDIGFFASRWLGVNLNPGQLAWLSGMVARDETGFRPKYLTTVCSAGNRAGKTLGMAVGVLHSATYKLGIKPPSGSEEDAMRWTTEPYEWYHIGIQQETAELVHRELSMLLQGGHPAQQGRGCPIVKEIGPVYNYEKKYRGEYLWIKVDPIFGGANIHFRTTQDKAKALLGKDMNGISFDEAAFEPHLLMIYQEVLNLRRLSTGGQLHFIGTPTEGINDYADLWELGNPNTPNRDEQFMSFRLSTRDNVGFGLRTETFDAIVRQQAEYLVPQNIDGYFIEARDAYFNAEMVDRCFVDFEEETQPANARRYSQGVDPGISSDATWTVTIDYTERDMMVGVRCRRKIGKQTIPSVVNMVREGHLLYNQDGAVCTSTIDSTGFGGKLFRQEFSIIKPLRDYDFGGTKAKKLELLADLKAVIDRGQVKFPRRGSWMELRRQLLGYKLNDKNMDTDAVMALALSVRHAVRNPTNPVKKPVFNYFGEYV